MRMQSNAFLCLRTVEGRVEVIGCVAVTGCVAVPAIREYIETVEGQSDLPELATSVGSSAKTS